MIDGLDDNERYIGTIVVKPAMDALAEFKLITNGYAAELGRTAGGVINLITKSGTSQFHGSLFEFFRNEKMDAKNFFAGPGARPAFKQNQFGGSLGGPIKKSNTFFFGDYEGLRLRQGITFTSSVPTLAMRTGDFTGLSTIYDPSTRTPYPANQVPAGAMDPVSAKLVNLWPAAQKAGLVNNFTMSPNKQAREDKFDARVDHQFNTSKTLFGRFSFNDGNIVTPGALPAVTVPSLRKAGFRAARASRLASSRTDSSRVIISEGAPRFFAGTVTGTTSALKRPSFHATAALRCEFRA